MFQTEGDAAPTSHQQRARSRSRAAWPASPIRAPRNPLGSSWPAERHTQDQGAVACDEWGSCAILKSDLHIERGGPVRTNIEIDDALLAEAMAATGLKTKRKVVEA
ncbi:MAG: type II toxin-antitoxin system VapB family antitoxin, partial [Geminicoccales bacterium]